MIYTNRDQRPLKFSLEANDVMDRIGAEITKGRVRQIGRGYGSGDAAIGWLQFKAELPNDGEFQFPFKQNHVYSEKDVKRAIEFMNNCKEKDDRYKIKLHRWYSEEDLEVVIQRSKKLKKKTGNGELTIVIKSTKEKAKRKPKAQSSRR